MKQVNFFVIFVLILALALFTLENTTPATINLFKGTKVEVPIAVELIIAMGIGAVLAWLFSAWASMQNMMEFHKKNAQIQNLQEQVSELTVEIDERKRLMSASAIDVEVEEKTKVIEGSKSPS
ncbi:lipopolysaccharide assembly LapA domain-containing protein [Pseudanabaena sp. PCC 6802]|uniref:LapA family protein n=1 Tax=Pseudanabaena sp. PCC 6802 TaxID=118173 RepID=UPI00034C3089|nr:LapA family protein [Pseudanabaena sp. PCC 6802]